MSLIIGLNYEVSINLTQQHYLMALVKQAVSVFIDMFWQMIMLLLGIFSKCGIKLIDRNPRF